MSANPVPEFDRTAVASALDAQLGLFRMEELRLATGRCRDGPTIPQALWYFVDEAIALPRPGVATAGFSRGMRARADLARWAATHAIGGTLDAPPLIWIGAPERLRDATLSADGSTLFAGEARWAFDLVPKIALNRSYYDGSSTRFFAGRTLAVRGTSHGSAFTARTLWPEEFRLDPGAPRQAIDSAPEALRSLVRARPQGGAREPFNAIVLWEREPGAVRRWDGAPVLAALLNGAQGDDDEAHAGHFALVTGYVGADGAIGEWITNNFYTLDAESEKGILPAMVPLDNYLGDLNSGQAWYRPSYLVVAVLKRERVTRHIQGALERTYNQFYRHQLVYRHATMNCASISVDVLRVLGLDVLVRGPTSRLAAWLGFPYFALRDRSLAKAAQTFDYLTEDRTRLMPAAAFEEIGARMLGLARGGAGTPSALEAALGEDLEAIVFLSVPQFPSSRAWGTYPVATAWEYRDRYPSDPAKAKIIPVPMRPFPDALRDEDLLPPPRERSEVAVAIWAIISIVGIPWLAWRAWQRIRKGRADRMAASRGTETAPSGNAPTPQ